ncbi:MAG: hypothetical protein ACREVW_06975, partial [Burkholderiales bacterium]
MTQLIYYVAVSLDGFVAPPDGSLDWLAPYNAGGEDYGFSEFYKLLTLSLRGAKPTSKLLPS